MVTLTVYMNMTLGSIICKILQATNLLCDETLF